MAKIASLNIVIDDTLKREEWQELKRLEECDDLGLIVFDALCLSQYFVTDEPIKTLVIKDTNVYVVKGIMVRAAPNWDQVDGNIPYEERTKI